MLASVFYMQPVGYLLATLVTLGVTRQYESSIPSDIATAICDEECIRAVDRSWRLIIGIGKFYFFWVSVLFYLDNADNLLPLRVYSTC